MKRKSSPAIIDAGGPIEDTDIAIQKMMDSGFDLDKDIDGGKPMAYFVTKGDLKMCLYLFVNGAKYTPTGTHFPLFLAAQKGYLDICKWLYMHGAKEDIQKLVLSGCVTSLRITIIIQLT
jgi:hypothetical protein